MNNKNKTSLKRKNDHKSKMIKFNKKKKIKIFSKFEAFGNMAVKLEKRDFVTAEQETFVYKELCWKKFGLLCATLYDLRETFWDFVEKVAKDFVDIVEFFIYFIKKLAAGIARVFNWIGDRFWDIIFYIDQHKVKIFTNFASIVSSVAIILILVSSLSAYEYSYYGKSLGVAKSKQEVYRTIEALGDKLSEVTGANINMDVKRDIQFTRVFGFNVDVDTSDEILNTLTYMKDLQATGYAIKINGNTAVIMESQEVANKVISDFKNVFIIEKEGVEYTSIEFDETINIEEVQVLLADIWNQNDALQFLLTGSVNEVEDEDKRQLLTLRTIETAKYDEAVDFGIDYVENPSMYTDENSIISNGTYGKDEIVAIISRVNGKEQTREIVSTQRVSNPINAVYYQGSKPIPALYNNSGFAFPLYDNIPYNVTAVFHEKYGVVGASTYHTGVDFAVPVGSTVYASNAGYVQVVAYDAALGNYIQIEHGGLLITIYAHLSNIYVTKGQYVNKEQAIGASGNTGLTTGPHLHFEMRYKGERVDPLGYIYLP